MENIFKQTFNIAVTEIDKNNKLKPTGILNFLQTTAGVTSDKVGFSLNHTKTNDLVWLLLGWKLEMFGSAKWNDKLTITTWAKELSGVASIRNFEIYVDNTLIGKASSKWILYNSKSSKITKISPEIIEAYGTLDKSVFNDELHKKLTEPENYTSVYNYNIRRSDIDPNNHVNNAFYLDFAIEALPDDVYEAIDFSKSIIEIFYKKEAKEHEDIVCLYSKTNNNEHIVTIKSADHKILHSIVKITV